MPRRERSGESRPRRERSRDQGHSTNAESDYLLEAAEENWPHILTAYRQFEDKMPVVLYDIQERRIYVYPYADFLRDLSEKSQITLKDQYERAVQDNKIVVFVRDNERRRLVSFSMDYE
jgi:hypothetical protein